MGPEHIKRIQTIDQNGCTSDSNGLEWAQSARNTPKLIRMEAKRIQMGLNGAQNALNAPQTDQNGCKSESNELEWAPHALNAFIMGANRIHTGLSGPNRTKNRPKRT